MGRRTLLVIASVLVAAAGTALIWMYVRGADSRAKGRWQEEVGVLVATGPIQVGSSRADIEAASTPQAIPKMLVPERPVTSASAVGTRTTAVPILAGQILVEGQFDPGNAVTVVPDGHVAVAVSMDDPNRVASLLRPGSEVAIYQVGDSRSARLLLSPVRVLGVGSVTAARSASGGSAKVGTQSGVPAALVTLDLQGRDAPKIIANREALYFTLLGKGAQVTQAYDVQGGAAPRTSGN